MIKSDNLLTLEDISDKEGGCGMRKIRNIKTTQFFLKSFPLFFLLIFLSASLSYGDCVFVNNNGSPNAVEAFHVNTTGSLTLVPGSPFPTGVSGKGTIPLIGSIALTNNRLYVTNSNVESNSVSGFNIDATDCTLSAIPGSPWAAGSFPMSVKANPAGTFLYVANLMGENISVYSITSNGSLTPIVGSPFTAPGHAFDIKISADGQFLFISLNSSIGVYTINSNDGSIAAIAGSPFAVAGATGLTLSPLGTRLYTTDSASSIHGRSISAGGALSVLPGSPYSAGSRPLDVLVNPSDTFLFAANNDSNNISVYSIAADGSLGLVSGAPFSSSGNFPAGLAVDPTGSFLYVANGGVHLANDVGVYKIAADGSITPIAGSPFVANGGVPTGIVYFPTITVTNTHDGGAGSLREAITSAAPGDTIIFGVTGTIVLTTGELLIEKNLTISGPGAGSLVISGNNASRVFKITAGIVSISGLTIQNGNVPSGQLCGGGIKNSGALTLNDVVVKNNTVNGTVSSDVGGGICNSWGAAKATLTINNGAISGNTADRGGGIFHTGEEMLSITNSTISGNTARAAGGMANYSTATFTNVTISGNTATGNSGGIGNLGTVTLTNVTISGNTAPGDGGGIGNYTQGSIKLRNTIVANNPLGGNCSGAIISNGHNLSSDDACGFTGTGDLNNTDPLLGPLQDNGGPTFTHALLPGSPAIDAGDPANFPATDQRGVPRPQGTGPDIGAYEWTPVYPYEGTIGTEITISGSDFGTKKGKVLVGSASMKILEWADGSIKCQLPRALSPDTYGVTIRLQAKGATPISIQNGFTVKAPEIDSVDPTSGSAGSEIAINGFFFGTKKGKVTLGGKSCKVLSWTMDKTTGESEIHFVVPKGLPPGTHELIVTTTKVGSDTVNFTVE